MNFFQLQSLLFVLFTFAVALPSPAAVPDGEFDEHSAFLDAALNRANEVRAQHGASPMEWDDDAANFAAQWLQNCEFAHSVCLFLLS